MLLQNILKSLQSLFFLQYESLKTSLNKNSISIMIFVIHTSTTSLPTPTGKPAFNSLQCMLSENKPKNTLQVIWPRKWLYRELFTAFFQHWVNLISLSKSPFFGLLKRSNTCLICAGGPLGDLYATAIHSSANRDFLYMESGSISGPCINLA